MIVPQPRGDPGALLARWLAFERSGREGARAQTRLMMSESAKRTFLSPA